MKKIILGLFLSLVSCTVEDMTPIYKEGQQVTLKDGRKVTIDKQVPAGYIVSIANKFEVKYFQITDSQIVK